MTRAPGLLLAGCAALAACGGAPGPCRLSLATQAPLRVDRGRFFTTFGVNGHDASMLVDTGSALTVLTPEAAARYGARLAALPRPVQLSGIGGSRLLRQVVAPDDVTFGRLHGSAFELLAAPIGPPGDSPRGPEGVPQQGAEGGRAGVDGILGMDLMGASDVDFDVLGGKLTLYAASGKCDAPPTRLDGELYGVKLEAAAANPHALPAAQPGADPRPRVRATVAGHEMRVLLDTGAAVSVLFRDAAARIGQGVGAPPDAAGAPVRSVSGIGPERRRSVRYVSEAVDFGDVTVRNLPFEVIDQRGDGIDMLLGQDFLQKVHLWLSNSGRALILQVPPAASPPAPAPG